MIWNFLIEEILIDENFEKSETEIATNDSKEEVKHHLECSSDFWTVIISDDLFEKD